MIGISSGIESGKIRGELRLFTSARTSRSSVLSSASADPSWVRPIVAHTLSARWDSPATVWGNEVASAKAPFSLIKNRRLSANRTCETQHSAR